MAADKKCSFLYGFLIRQSENVFVFRLMIKICETRQATPENIAFFMYDYYE